ncbi:hypothetical protein IW261DRAFT_1438709 [Armillaria novae-zelandiae]|uniref:DUF6533 domain-containing protein n=1 Tax=Armillaria novae-zelandiae TaxID=153914 RepID=A0AA39PYU8_9AGAR|nr:hypothetical protein IW261DRAFT_1438709 [Armillaria novae-zelandiae]
MAALAIMETSPAAFLAVRFSPTAAACLMIWDHLLTLDQEIDAIWLSRDKGYLPKLIYVLNRYFAEGVLLYTAYVWGGYSHNLTDAVSSGVLLVHCTGVLWLFTVSSTVMVGLLQFIIAMRVYRSWDNQKRAGCVLLVAFSACTSAAIILAVITVIILLMSRGESAAFGLIFIPHMGNVCFVNGLPRTIPALLATLLAFDILIVLMVLYRALEIPRRTHIEAINSFHRDGARLYLVLLWLLLLIVSITSQNEPHIFFSILCASWALNTNIGCRVHLRVEGLKHLVDGEMPWLIYRNSDDFELYYR